MNRTDVRNALERLIEGDLRPEEAVRLAKASGYASFADMCEDQLPERLPRVRLERSLVRARVAHAVHGALSLAELRAWAEELATVLERHELGVSISERRRLSEALALVAVATDVRIFKNTQPVLGVLRAVARSLGRRRASNLGALYGQLFYFQPEFHLLTRRLEDGGDAEEEPRADAPPPPPSYLPQVPSFLEDLGLGDLELDSGGSEWSAAPAAPPEEPEASQAIRCADVVALNRPYEAGTRVHDYEWVVAFSVATRSLVQEDTVPGVSEDAFIARARELAPNFDLATYRPEARRDQDGVLELVLDAEAITRKELVYAAKLFAMVHQTGRVYFEGRRLPTLR
ncbi:MAG: hypothetical protein AB7N76_32090 [Planctomycetota bacterium]